MVVYQVKDTIFWKQITTGKLNKNVIYRLFIKSKIQFFESKSQLINCSRNNRSCCLSSQRYNFLKANHNMLSSFSNVSIVVYQVKDTIFWKQITTRIRCMNNVCMLFIKSKIQFFELKIDVVKANHNTFLKSVVATRLFKCVASIGVAKVHFYGVAKVHFYCVGF